MLWTSRCVAAQREWQRRISRRQDTSSCSQRITTPHFKLHQLVAACLQPEARWSFLHVQSTHWESLWISSWTFFFFSGAKLCQSWLQWAGMQLYLRCHSGIRSAVCSFDKGTSSQRAGLIRTCWSQSEEIAFWSRRTSVCGKLKMAKNHHSHFSAPVVTKAHWKKPSHVSSFDVETCGIEDITRWQTAEGIWQRSQQRLGRLPYKVRLKLQNLTAHVACLVKWWTEEKCTFALELFLVPFSAVFHWFKQM